MWRIALIAAAAFLWTPGPAGAEESHAAAAMGSELSLATVAPFVALLLCIAILPMAGWNPKGAGSPCRTIGANGRLGEPFRRDPPFSSPRGDGEG